jgi:Uma2 family endonuclease
MAPTADPSGADMTATALSRPLHYLDLPNEYGYTVADLHGLPDDGRRYELIDGSIIVSPSATIDHNTIAHWITAALWASVPNDDYVIGLDQSTRIDDHNEPRPDVIAAPAAFSRQSPFPIGGSLLVVEVVSPSSVLRDTETKRALYAKAGIPSYWIVVPEPDEPTIALAELVLDGDTYRYATHYTRDLFATEAPWPVQIDLPALTAKRARYWRA